MCTTSSSVLTRRRRRRDIRRDIRRGIRRGIRRDLRRDRAGVPAQGGEMLVARETDGSACGLVVWRSRPRRREVSVEIQVLLVGPQARYSPRYSPRLPLRNGSKISAVSRLCLAARRARRARAGDADRAGQPQLSALRRRDGGGEISSRYGRGPPEIYPRSTRDLFAGADQRARQVSAELVARDIVHRRGRRHALATIRRVG